MFEVQWNNEGKATAMGQLAFFAEFLQASGLFEHWLRSCPLRYSSPCTSKRLISVEFIFVSLTLACCIDA